MKQILILLTGCLTCLAARAQNHLDSLERAGSEAGATTIWTYGLPEYPTGFNRHKVGARYGIGYRHVGACLLPREDMERIREHNRVADSAISCRLGNGWQALIDKEVYADYLADRALLDSLGRYAPLADTFGKLLNMTGGSWELRVLPTASPDTVHIVAAVCNGYGESTGESFFTIVAIRSRQIFRVLEARGRTGTSLRPPR